MHKIKHFIVSLIAALAIITPTASAIPVPLTQFGAPCGGGRILTFPAWHKGLDCIENKDENGRVLSLTPRITNLNQIWVIVLNVVEILIMAAAYIAVGFIIWGGIKYIKAQGEPGKITEAKTTIIQAVIGLAIALLSVAIVEFVTGSVVAG